MDQPRNETVFGRQDNRNGFSVHRTTGLVYSFQDHSWVGILKEKSVQGADEGESCRIYSICIRNCQRT